MYKIKRFSAVVCMQIGESVVSLHRQNNTDHVFRIVNNIVLVNPLAELNWNDKHK